ncbi:MAG TPA: hypothetical protein VGR50_06540 [Terriglobales bacterium]|nr:hypothetical protein [Terriglobales bacterium]
MAGNPPQLSTNQALQYFDAVQYANGNCATFSNNQLCATTVIEAGDTVKWAYQDTLGDFHSATSGTCSGVGICTADGTFDTGIFPTVGNLYSYPFPSANVYPYFCRVHGANMTGTVIVQDYTVAINPSLAAYPNSTATFNGVLTGLPVSNPYSYSVNLVCNNASAGLNCNPPASATPTAAGASAAVVTSAAAVGDYTFQLLALGGASDPDYLIHSSGTATLHVIDLSLNSGLNPVTLSSNGASASFPIGSVNASASFPNPVMLSCGGLPAGASCNFTPSNSVQPNGSSQNLGVAVTTSGSPAGNYTITINADPGGGLAAQTTSFPLQVQDFSYTLTTPTVVPVQAGANAMFSGTLNSLNNYAGTVALACQAGAPATCTASAPVMLAAGATNVAAPTITASSAVNGPFSFNIQASGSSLGAVESQHVTVNVGDFNFPAPSNTALSAVPGNPSNAANFTLSTVGVFSAQVTLACSGLPAGASCAFFPSNIVNLNGVTETTSMVIETDSTTPVASGTVVTVTATGNGISHTQPVKLNVNAGSGSADMQVTLTPPAHPVLAGSQVNFSVMATNNGPNAASGVALAFNVDSGATVIGGSAAPGYTCHVPALPIICDTTGPPLASGSSVSFTFTVQAPFGRSMDIAAQVSSGATDPMAGNNSTANPLLIRLRPWIPKGTPPQIP